MNFPFKNNGIFFFQETHSTPADVEQWSNEWGGKLIFSHGSSDSRGVLIGFSKNFDVEFIETTSDKKR